MNIKELIFGGGVKAAGGGAWRDSIQAWLPIKNIVGGVVVTRDNRFIKILEVLPVNIYLKSPNDRQNIISSYAAWLKIAPDNIQLEARILRDGKIFLREYTPQGVQLEANVPVELIHLVKEYIIG